MVSLRARAAASSGSTGVYTYQAGEISQIRTDIFLVGYHMIFLGILSTLSVILILFSTRKQRRSLILVLQLISMSTVLTLEIIFVVYMYRDIANIINQRAADDPAVTSLEKRELVEIHKLEESRKPSFLLINLLGLAARTNSSVGV
jgi:hypothetical protein